MWYVAQYPIGHVLARVGLGVLYVLAASSGQAIRAARVLEQANGVLAQQDRLGRHEAFVVDRRYARDHNLRLSDLAAAPVARQLPGQQLLERTRTSRP